jgi:predicted enzyme related to lactoylglutathione lyase
LYQFIRGRIAADTTSKDLSMLSTNYAPGAPNWLDLSAPDTRAAIAFYGGVFDWQHQSAGPEAGGYGFFQHDGKTVAGIGPLAEDGTPATWNLYFHTPDADATAKAVEQAGGRVRTAPMDVFSYGRVATFTDSTGADFGVWQPRETPGLEVVNDFDTFFWAELYTTDATASKNFYGSVFSWQFTDMDMGGEMTYTLLMPSGGDQDAAHGGLMGLPEENLRAGAGSEWHPYFAVTDCDATAARATGGGATVLMPPTDGEGIGRLAMFRDPAGAPFAIITPSPE